MKQITKITATFDDGSTEDIFPVTAPAAPTITEVKVDESDGSEQTFTPDGQPA